MHIICLIGSLLCLICSVYGHGILLDPPGRSSAWRAGFNTPKNYDDNGISCGGAGVHQANGGKCGVCGDPWTDPVPRKNEAGGIYATGVIVRNYTAGQVIHVRVDITANHRGWMEFRLCPNNDVNKAITHACLNKHLLEFADGSGTRYQVTTGRSGYYNMLVKLPERLTCTQCVIQWKYHGGNSWGVDPVTKRGCVGCGPQEEFYGCADVGISHSGNFQPFPVTSSTTSTSPKPLTTETSTTTAKTTTHRPPTQQTTVGHQLRCWGINNWAGQSALDAWCTRQCRRGNCPEYSCACTTGPHQGLNTPKATTTTKATPTAAKVTPTRIFTQKVCRAIGPFAGNAVFDKWCDQECSKGVCPPSNCQCSNIQLIPLNLMKTSSTTTSTTTTTTTQLPAHAPCTGRGTFSGSQWWDNYCKQQCNQGYCAISMCNC